MQRGTGYDIEQICTGKVVLVYGLGQGVRQFFEQYGNSISVADIIDNDTSRQEKFVGDFLPEAFGTKCSDIQIHSVDVLEKYDPENTIVLIASAKHYEEIEQDLKNRGFENTCVISNLSDFAPELNCTKTVLEKQQEYIEKCVLLPIEKRKIIFSSFANYADHEKYISEALAQAKQALDIVWLVNDLDADLPDNVRKVLKSNWKKVLYEVETAAIWISDVAVPEIWKKRPEQIYIQTKHWASITLKKFYLDADTFNSEPAKLTLWKRESEIIDYIVVGSEFDRESCKRGFQFDKEFIMAGSPRSDGLFHEEENKRKVYAHYGLKDDTQILMYAPTYRFSKEKGKSVHQSREIQFDYEAVKNALVKRFGGEWMIALRLHPSVATAVKEMSLPDFVFDVSGYEDSEELVSAFAITISDFSSLMFEPAFVKKPVFLYATDLEDYLENEYELLLDYRELPFDIAENTEQLCNNILNFDETGYVQNLKEFFGQYGVREDGHASERVADFIMNLITIHR